VRKVLQIHCDRPSVHMSETSSNSIEQNPPSESNRPSANEENLRILLNLESQIKLFMPPSHFLELQFNIILPSTPRSCKWSLSLRFFHQNTVCTSRQYAPHIRPSHSSWYDHQNNENEQWSGIFVNMEIITFGRTKIKSSICFCLHEYLSPGEKISRGKFKLASFVWYKETLN